MFFLLLQDGLNRAYQDEEIGEILQQNLRLLNVHHINELDPNSDYADVVYLDPMYPHKQKSALVKKEMRVFQHLVGADLDADELLLPALQLAKKRVVVKRPDYAEFLLWENNRTLAVKRKIIALIFIWEHHNAKRKCRCY